MKNTWLFLSLEEVLLLHKKEINRFGGNSGMLNRGLLLSALSQAEIHLFGEPVYKRPYEIAAIYAYHIIKNHPFNDGNKRTGILVAMTFLGINGLYIETDNKALYQLAIDIASSNLNKEEVIGFFKKKVKRL